jgi:hypothetical protein
MKLNSLAGIVQVLLKGLPTGDDPVLNSSLFCFIFVHWLQRAFPCLAMFLFQDSTLVIDSYKLSSFSLFFHDLIIHVNMNNYFI